MKTSMLDPSISFFVFCFSIISTVCADSINQLVSTNYWPTFDQLPINKSLLHLASIEKVPYQGLHTTLKNCNTILSHHENFILSSNTKMAAIITNLPALQWCYLCVKQLRFQICIPYYCTKRKTTPRSQYQSSPQSNSKPTRWCWRINVWQQWRQSTQHMAFPPPPPSSPSSPWTMLSLTTGS